MADENGNKITESTVNTETVSREEFNIMASQLQGAMEQIAGSVNDIGSHVNKTNREELAKLAKKPKHTRINLTMKKELDDINYEETQAREKLDKHYFTLRKQIKDKYKDEINDAYVEKTERDMEKYEDAGEAIGKFIGTASNPIKNVFTGIKSFAWSSK